MGGEQQYSGSARSYAWLLAGIGLFAALGGYWYVDTATFKSDAALVEQLSKAKLPSPEAPAAGVGDWAQWRGPNRDGVSRETGLLTDWPTGGPLVAWSAPVGKGFSSLAVAGGRVFTLDREGQNEAVLCWDAADGREIWRFRYPCPLPFRLAFGDGPRATPAVDGGRVYCPGATGIFHCLRADSGEVAWRKYLPEIRTPSFAPGAWGHCCSPLVEGDLVFTQTGSADGAVAAFDKGIGALVWKALDDPPGCSSPVAVTIDNAAAWREIRSLVVLLNAAYGLGVGILVPMLARLMGSGRVT